MLWQTRGKLQTAYSTLGFIEDRQVQAPAHGSHAQQHHDDHATSKSEGAGQPKRIERQVDPDPDNGGSGVDLALQDQGNLCGDDILSWTHHRRSALGSGDFVQRDVAHGWSPRSCGLSSIV